MVAIEFVAFSVADKFGGGNGFGFASIFFDREGLLKIACLTFYSYPSAIGVARLYEGDMVESAKSQCSLPFT